MENKPIRDYLTMVEQVDHQSIESALPLVSNKILRRHKCMDAPRVAWQ